MILAPMSELFFVYNIIISMNTEHLFYIIYKYRVINNKYSRRAVRFLNVYTCTNWDFGNSNQINDKREERGVTLEKIICTQNIHENTTLTVRSNK